MSIEFRDQGSIFDIGADAVVIPVNCKGVAGKGVALEAKKRWESWFIYYRSKNLFPGSVSVLDRVELRHGLDLPHPSPRYILSAATKGHWRSKSNMLDIAKCLANIRAWTIRNQPDLIAMPAIGCGLGGLPWAQVRDNAERCFDMSQFQGDLTHSSRVVMFAPQ